MVKKKILVFISEPSWIENPIPSWLNNNDYFVVTESDSVINECYLKKIDVFALGEYIEPSKNIYFIDKSIEIERTEINNLTNKLDKNSYQAELYHGISNKIYYLNYYHETIENLFKKCSFDKAIFVVGERFLASNEETPKGSLLQYYLIKDTCRKYNIKFSKKNNQIYTFKKINSIKKRYDFYFSQNNLENNKTKFIEIQKSNYNKDSSNPNVLFIYQYEACKDDLEPLLDLELMSSNVLKMSITPYAPKNYEYDFELSTLNYDNKSFNLEYNYDFILNIFKKHLFLKNEKILEIITRKYYNYYYNINVRLIESISKIDKVIKQYRIKKIFLTGFPGTTTSVIAKYFISKNINVVLRQHGEISAPYWPLQCYVKGVEFSTISNFYKSSLIKFTNNITITPRYYINPIEISKKKINNKRILITNDLFFNPQNKLLFINFFKSFITNINHKYNITLRSHPRYFGDLLPGFINNELKFENSREVDLVDSLNDCSLFIMPADTFSSIIASAIRFEIPSVIIAPLSSISVYNFEPYYFNYPFIINNENSLFDFIHKVENNISFKEEVILIQKKWLNSILEEKSIKKDHKLIHRNIKSTFNNKISYTIYYKLYIKNLLKFLYLIFST